jgi:4'-phosphopantetheinyl transferase
MVKVYYTSFDGRISDELFMYYKSLLPENMQHNIDRFHKWQDAQRSLLGKLLLMKALQDFKSNKNLDDIMYSIFQRPALCCQVDFNISHSGNFIVCAISDESRVGIDIEKYTSINFQDYSRCMKPNEWNTINDSEQPEYKFLDYWTKKEAVIKGNGQGLSIDLDIIHIDSEGAWLDDEYWYLQKIFLHQDYVIHIATDTQLVEKLIVEKVSPLCLTEICQTYSKKNNYYCV